MGFVSELNERDEVDILAIRQKAGHLLIALGICSTRAQLRRLPKIFGDYTERHII